MNIFSYNNILSISILVILIAILVLNSILVAIIVPLYLKHRKNNNIKEHFDNEEIINS